MGGIDETIREIGLAITIVREAGDVETYAYVKPKLKQATYDYEAWFMTDSGVVLGDLILSSGIHYLVVGISRDERVQEFFKYNVRLYRCSHTVTVKRFSRDDKDFVVTIADIPCLIVDQGIMQLTDKAIAIPGFSGTDDSYSLYCQPHDIKDDDVLVSNTGNKLRISGDLNPFFAEGLISVPVKVEG